MNKYVACITSGLVVSLFSASALATNVCDGDPSKAAKVEAASDGSKFVRNEFTPKCSNNVVLDYSDAGTSFAVASGSKKGKSTFVGNSAGGGIVAGTKACPASGCTKTETAEALTEAEAIATASSSTTPKTQ